jgi:hypothetical protein
MQSPRVGVRVAITPECAYATFDAEVPLDVGAAR